MTVAILQIMPESLSRVLSLCVIMLAACESNAPQLPDGFVPVDPEVALDCQVGSCVFGETPALDQKADEPEAEAKIAGYIVKIEGPPDIEYNMAFVIEGYGVDEDGKDVTLRLAGTTQKPIKTKAEPTEMTLPALSNSGAIAVVLSFKEKDVYTTEKSQLAPMRDKDTGELFLVMKIKIVKKADVKPDKKEDSAKPKSKPRRAPQGPLLPGDRPINA